LQKKLYELQSSVEQGIMLESNYNVLAAEKLNAKQRLTEQVQQSTAIVDMLNVITNMTITTNDSLEVFEPKKIKTCNRQQLHVFELQQKSFDAGKLALQKNRMPLFSAFTQVGYGKPGLNMLKNEADSYLLAGARISWNIFDWNTTKRQQQKLTYKQEMIEAQKEQFLQQVETQTQQYLSDIEKYETLLLRDNKIIKLRQKITEDYSSRLKQGTVTSSAYVDELFKEKTARITKEIHAIKLIQSHTALQIILEK
jgi:outer membrane protein TolC